MADTTSFLFFPFVQILEAVTMQHIFMNNFQLCSEINERVVQHFVHCIETHGRNVQYLKFLQTIVKAENKFIKKCQDIVMAEVILCTYLVFDLFYSVFVSWCDICLFLPTAGECRRRCSGLLQRPRLLPDVGADDAIGAGPHGWKQPSDVPHTPGRAPGCLHRGQERLHRDQV